MILDMLRGDRRIAPERVCIDHVEEHTIRLALDAGHWVGMTLYPTTKCTPARAADMVETFGTERILVNSAGDWGHSDPLAVPEFIFEMRSRGHDEATIRKRFDIYRRETSPVLEFYPPELILEIDALGTPEEVAAAIERGLLNK